MGQATAIATRKLDRIRYRDMQGALVLKDRTAQGNEYRAVFVQEKCPRGVPGDPHIEESLLAKLRAHYYGDLSRIPNNAGLVFFGRFSPCKQCTVSGILGHSEARIDG
jgi:hypothetical protein